MGLFRRKDKDQDAGPHLSARDAGVLAALRQHGADLTQPREMECFLYFPDPDSAEAAATEARDDAWSVEVSQPMPEERVWAVVCRREAVLTDEYVGAVSATFTRLAQAHGGEYDGWGTAV